MEKRVKRLCLGAGRLPTVVGRDEDPRINPGDVIHRCPVCSRTWGRNSIKDWSDLPIPRHMVVIDPRPRDGAPPARYYHPRIQFWDDERSSGSGILVTLFYGFTFEGGQHCGVKGFDSGAEAYQAVKDSDFCYCSECLDVLERGHE